MRKKNEFLTLVAFILVVPLVLFGLGQLEPLPADSPYVDPYFMGIYLAVDQPSPQNTGALVIFLAIVGIYTAIILSMLWQVCQTSSIKLDKLLVACISIILLDRLICSSLFCGFGGHVVPIELREVISSNPWLRRCIAWMAYYDLSAKQTGTCIGVFTAIGVALIVFVFSHRTNWHAD